MQKGSGFSVSDVLCVWVLFGGCVWNQQSRGDSSPLDMASQYAPNFRGKK